MEERRKANRPADPLVAQKLSTGKYYLSCGIPPRQRILKEGNGTKEEIKGTLKKKNAKERTKEGTTEVEGKTIFLIRFGNCVLKRAKTRSVGFKMPGITIIIR